MRQDSMDTPLPDRVDDVYSDFEAPTTGLSMLDYFERAKMLSGVLDSSHDGIMAFHDRRS